MNSSLSRRTRSPQWISFQFLRAKEPSGERTFALRELSSESDW